MQITPFSPPLTPAAVAPGAVSHDGAAFEKLMAPFGSAGREGAASGQGKASGAEAGADEGESEAITADAVLAAAEAGPEDAGDNLQFIRFGSVQAPAVPSPGAAVPPAEITTSAGLAAVLTESAAAAAKLVPAAAFSVVRAGPPTIGAADEATDQTVFAGQRPEARATRHPATGGAETRLAAGAEVLAAAVRQPPATAAQTTPVTPAEIQSANGLAVQAVARGAPAVSPDAAPSGPALPLNAASAAPAPAAAERANRRPASPAPTAAQDTGVPVAAEVTAEAGSGRRVQAAPSAYDTSQLPHEAKSPKPADGANLPAPKPVPVVTDFRADLAGPTGIARDGVAGAGPAATGSGTASPGAPPPSSQLSQTIVQIIQRGADTPVEVTLRPEELGKVRFDLMTTGDRLHITLFVERPEAMDLIRRHGEQLLNDLRQSGFSHPSLSFGDWSQRDTRPAKPAAPPKPSEGAAAAYDIPAGPTARMVATGRLDLRL